MTYQAVRTTGIYCVPSCSARPLPGNVRPYAAAAAAEAAGHSPCLSCRPYRSPSDGAVWVKLDERRFDRGQRVQFIFNGSTLLKNQGFGVMVKLGLRAGWPGALVAPLSRPSVWGAVELARSLTLSPAGGAKRKARAKAPSAPRGGLT